MNKRITAVAALALTACSGTALAQSNVAFYGVMDLGISQDRGGVAGISTRVTSGMATQSRWGFRGSEDLGSGNSAFFVIEGGRLQFDQGSLKVPTAPGLGVTLDHEALARLHDNYQRCGIRFRDDLAQMRKYDPSFTGAQPRF